MNAQIPPEIIVWATNKSFLNIYDCLDIERIKFEVASYDRNTRRQTARAVAYVHVNKVRAAFQAVMDGSFPSAWFGKQETNGGPVPGVIESFGGGEQEGQVVSRIFRLEVDPGDRGQFALKPYRITVTNGPGVRTRTGGIAPAKGGQMTRVSMRFSVAEMREIAAAVVEYISAYTVTHFAEIRAARIAETARKMEERQKQTQASRPRPPQDQRKPVRSRGGNGQPRTPIYLPFEPKDPELKPYKNRPLAELLQAGEKGVKLLQWLVQNRPDTPLGREASYLLLQQGQAN